MDMLKKLFSLEGKVVIVTGGAQGIGKIVAEHIAAVGADIVIFDMQEEKAKATADSIAKEYNCKTMAVCADVTKPEIVAQAIEKAAAEMGTLDLLFNNAGIALPKAALDVKPDDWLKVININLNGVFFVSQAFAKYLVAHDKKGAIVNTASMSGTIINSPQKTASYNTSKAGVVHLTKSLAVEWCSKGIRVNCISPGYIFTELTRNVPQEFQDSWINSTPFKRMGTPEELAGAVIYLLSDSASYTSGCDLIVDGCFTLI
ncbi:glucose 1-dehydrogenase [Desulfosporosinus nitroreducens]|uniref:Glucose 1-dehydrogenase n=1 Tax=Desulfosporosinus nitroreducens TaxID=2018668 RepID=A0ABT8QSG5_9FIRM|nr:glucose 1-dehydrogenase [Desulfosporosinus nitroreducens]MCO1599949.1 glucose 1-dehydrogenase [Desulfosporosinus nitroreducens]MDO0823008.1 glucose 1-dehydrogenase [Desulfosporosinus nitroreducens]